MSKESDVAGSKQSKHNTAAQLLIAMETMLPGTELVLCMQGGVKAASKVSSSTDMTGCYQPYKVVGAAGVKREGRTCYDQGQERVEHLL